MRRPTRTPVEAEPEEEALPSLRFFHSEALRRKTITVIEGLEASDDPTTQRQALAAVVVELTETGLEYYFVKPVKAAGVGFMAEQSTRLGISTMLKVMAPMARRIIGGMDAVQLRIVTGHLRHLMQ